MPDLLCAHSLIRFSRLAILSSPRKIDQLRQSLTAGGSPTKVSRESLSRSRSSDSSSRSKSPNREPSVPNDMDPEEWAVKRGSLIEANWVDGSCTDLFDDGQRLVGYRIYVRGCGLGTARAFQKERIGNKPLRNGLCTSELQWQPRGERRILSYREGY